jgi:hypothetical protein
MQPEERHLQVAVGRQATDRLQHFLLKWIRLDDVFRLLNEFCNVDIRVPVISAFVAV